MILFLFLLLGHTAMNSLASCFLRCILCNRFAFQGRLCAAINAATLALVDAGIPMKDFVCACSAGYAGGGTDTTLVDLNRREESSSGGGSGGAAAYLPCAVMPQRGTVVLAQCESRLSNYETLERVLEAAVEGCRAMFDIMQAAVRERAAAVLAAQSGLATVRYSFAAA